MKTIWFWRLRKTRWIIYVIVSWAHVQLLFRKTKICWTFKSPSYANGLQNYLNLTFEYKKRQIMLLKYYFWNPHLLSTNREALLHTSSEQKRLGSYLSLSKWLFGDAIDILFAYTILTLNLIYSSLFVTAEIREAQLKS